MLIESLFTGIQREKWSEEMCQSIGYYLKEWLIFFCNFSKFLIDFYIFFKIIIATVIGCLQIELLARRSGLRRRFVRALQMHS